MLLDPEDILTLQSLLRGEYLQLGGKDAPEPRRKSVSGTERATYLVRTQSLDYHKARSERKTQIGVGIEDGVAEEVLNAFSPLKPAHSMPAHEHRLLSTFRQRATQVMQTHSLTRKLSMMKMAKTSAHKDEAYVREVRQRRRASTLKLFNLPTAVQSPIIAHLEKSNSWSDFDIFGLLEQLGGNETKAAQVVAYEVIEHEHGLLSEFTITPIVFLKFVDAVCGHYNDVPYHSCLHGADVMQGLHAMMHQSPKTLETLPRTVILAALVAAFCHDVGHPGRTGRFLINTSDPIALKYNDQSVLENMHVATTLQILTVPGCNFLASFPKSTLASIRSIWISMILETDMARHQNAVWSLERHTQHGTAYEGLVAGKQVETLSFMLHACDLSNPAKPWDTYRAWTDRVMEEFFAQSEEESALGIKVTLPRRENARLDQFQIGFIRFITPFWELLGSVSEINCDEQLGRLKKNCDRWLGIRSASSLGQDAE